MKILVINAGSSSIKYQLCLMQDEVVLAKGGIERIGSDSAILTHQTVYKPEVREVSEILDHTAAIRVMLKALVHAEYGAIQSITEIDGAGHRVVHGGETFSGSTLVTPEVKHEIKRLFDLAPLHNPANLSGILAMEANLPNLPQAVVFDTAFHQTMPEKVYLFPIPMVLYRKHKIRRYGFHGTSHEYVSNRAAQLLNRSLEDLKVISCHIGNGVSCTAIMNGRSFDTSMGLTPLDGLMMGTRSGDIDPAVVPFTMIQEDLTMNEVSSMLNKHSGLLAISGLSSDMRDIEEAMAAGHPPARLAFDMYEYRLRKYIGAYAAGMNGLDVLVFTAGVGENSNLLRKVVCSQLTFLGVQLDEELNDNNNAQSRVISRVDSRVAVAVVPTNEELMIAISTYDLIANQANPLERGAE
ncbi:MAG TPA: acetate kinase [Bacilli bacterium]